MYARMVIGEVNSENQVQDFARIYMSEVLPELEHESGFASARFMVEEEGRMAISLTRSRVGRVPAPTRDASCTCSKRAASR